MTFRLTATSIKAWKKSGKLDQVADLPKRVPTRTKAKKAAKRGGRKA